MQTFSLSSLFAAATAPLTLLSSALQRLLYARPLPGIPVHPGALPFFGHLLSLLGHLFTKGNVSGYWAMVLDVAGEGTEMVQVMILSNPV